MRLSRGREIARRRAISAIIGTILMVSALFVGGLGFFIFVNQNALRTSQADAARQAASVEASLERLQVNPRFTGGQLWITLNDTGGATATVIAVFVTSMTSSSIVSMSSSGTPYLTKQFDLNINLPIAVTPGIPTNQMKGCGPVPPGCDIALTKARVGNYSGTGPVVISVLTTSGNIFSGLYPPNPTSYTTGTTSTSATASTTVISGGAPSSNILVVQMVATPPLVFSCTACVTDNVTIYNYGSLPVTNVALSPAIPAVSVTCLINSCSLPNGFCTPPGSTTIPAYSGVGPAPSISFICTYDAQPGGGGGFASFSGSATGTYGGGPISSAISISNVIQIGGPPNLLSQGPFTANFFFFKYTACTNAPSTNPLSYGSPCTTNAPYPFGTPSSLPDGNILKDLNPSLQRYYVAFYVKITNGWNSSLTILPYSYIEDDTTTGSESAFFLVGNSSVGDNNGVSPKYQTYYPNYAPGGNNVPTLTAYSPSVSQCNKPNPGATCIQVESTRSVVLTFASCGIIPVPQNNWNWGGIQYGNAFDSQTCLPDNAPCFDFVGGANPDNCPPTSVPISTYVSIVISFLYKGQVYSQQIPFVGMIVTT